MEDSTETEPLMGSGSNQGYQTLGDPTASIPSRQLSIVDIYDSITLSWDDINVYVKGQKSRGLPCLPRKQTQEQPKHIIKHGN